MKKVVVGLFVVLGLFLVAGCGNSEGKEAYKEFKERYEIEYSKSEELDKLPLSVYDVKGTYYVKMINENNRARYHKWNRGSEIKEGLIYESEGDWTRLVGNAEPIYEQNMN
ncbi:hypothetical protein [Carnobacterium divergens]|uniref:hypothetical protein n=1 Tax=Carnobacterium divergens TaxID=2748 RepID=UPI00288D10B0|nr:hypothetical protein [Carnobacterium divergens]MDT2010827.1 hypothetical protein [Carnobacterium divergens]